MVEKQGIDATVVRLGNLPAEANPRGARPSRARRVQPPPRFNTPPRFPPTTTFPAITPRIFLSCLSGFILDMGKNQPKRRQSIAVLGHGHAKGTTHRRRAYSIAPGERLSPSQKARRLLVSRVISCNP